MNKHKLSKFDLPIKRIGNEKNPKLIIFLENPGSNPNQLKWSSEYTMYLDKVYKDCGMSFSIVKEYEKWWFELSQIWLKASKFADKDVLSMEFYPYSTHPEGKRKEIYLNPWNDYAQNSLKENRFLLMKFMKKTLPIFVYYKSNWLKSVPELNEYKPISLPNKNTYRSGILRRFSNFIANL